MPCAPVLLSEATDLLAYAITPTTFALHTPLLYFNIDAQH